MDCRNGFGCAGHGVRDPFGGNLRLWRERALSRLPAYSDRARPAYGELFRRIRRAFPVVGVRSAYGEVFRCMGSVMPSLRARPARVGVLKTTRSGSGRCRIVPLMWGYVRLPEPAHCGHWALLACVRKLGLSSTDPPLHGGAPRPCGEVSYSGTSSEFSRGSTSLVWESSGKMSPTPSASGGLPAHVGKLGRTKRGQFSVRGALRPCGEYAI